MKNALAALVTLVIMSLACTLLAFMNTPPRRR